MTLERIRSAYGWLLEAIVIVLMVALAVEVSVGIVFRAIGMALSWYDEIAVILLAWLTFYGSALAALKRAHIGFPGLVNSLSPRWRLTLTIGAKALVVAFLALLGGIGYSVLDVLATDYLISLPEVSVAWTQSGAASLCHRRPVLAGGNQRRRIHDQRFSQQRSATAAVWVQGSHG